LHQNTAFQERKTPSKKKGSWVWTPAWTTTKIEGGRKLGTVEVIEANERKGIKPPTKTKIKESRYMGETGRFVGYS